MKRYIAQIILLAILSTTLLMGGVAFAATNVSMDTTDVLTDLQGSKIAGENFNPDNFSYSGEKEPVVLSFAEFGFSYDTKSQGDYGVYVYVYNPTGTAINDTSLNKISIATVYQDGKAIDYEKFTLQCLSASTGKYAYLFYKFKVQNADKLWLRVSHNANLRRYDVSEIELNFGKSTSDAFTVGNYYEYSGYAQGYGADPNADSTLTCNSDSIQTLRLDVKSTYYRYNNGYTTSSNLSSVYFGVPSETLAKYGKLQQIKANWFETHTEQLPVLTDAKLYDFLFSHIGISTQQQSFNVSDCTASSGKNYKYIAGGKAEPYITSTDVYNKYYFHYDGQYHEDNSKFFKPNYNVDFYVNKLTWLFYSKSGLVSSDEVLHFAQNYSKQFGGDLLIDKYSKELFVAEVDDGRQYGWQGDNGQGIVIDADSLFDIDGFTTGSKFFDWWQKVFYPDTDFDDIENIAPIYIVKDSDVLGTTSTIASKLLIDENDVGTFKDVYAQNKLQGKQTVLFRFATTKYTSLPLYGARGAFNVMDKVGYMAQETAFLDFDVIWLKFVKENQSTVIPVVSSPIDVFSGLTPPLGNAGLNLLSVVLAIVLFVAIVYAAYKLVCVIVKKK